MSRIRRIFIFSFVLWISPSASYTQSSQTRWISRSDTIHVPDSTRSEYLIHFRYPSIYHCEWNEGVLCINKPGKASELNPWATWDIGLWDKVTFPNVSYDVINESFYLKKFRGDLIEYRDTIMISGQSALRVTRTQKHGRAYSQDVMLKLDCGILGISNDEKASTEFDTLCKSITISKIR